MWRPPSHVRVRREIADVPQDVVGTNAIDGGFRRAQPGILRLDRWASSSEADKADG
jgi:hypothetical protein